MGTLARVFDRLIAGSEVVGRIIVDKTGDDARWQLATQASRRPELRSAFPKEVIDSTERYVVRLAAFTGYHWHLFTAYDGEGNVIGQVKDLRVLVLRFAR